MNKILVVDDEPRVLTSLEKILARKGYEVATSREAEGALSRLDEVQPDIAILDINLPGMTGLEAFTKLKESYPRMPVIIMTAQGTTDTAIEATKHGAFEYLLKPFEATQMLETVEKALKSVELAKRQVALDDANVPSESADVLIGQSPAMQEVYKAIGRVAPLDTTVLIRGDTGVGKELVARAIYQHSSRSEQPLYIVNCPSLPETLLESELFGHERGAFTGAHAHRIGKFEQANGATVFLDEIGDIPLSVQAKILRVLQDGSFQRIGGNETITSDARIIAATNQNLEEMIQENQFREDLFHRLNQVTIQIPPLRKRRQDMTKLLDFFLAEFARELGRDVPVLSQEARKLLETHPWPGNVRQLRHCIRRAMIFNQSQAIQIEDVENALKDGTQEVPAIDTGNRSVEGQLIHTIHEHLKNSSGPMAYRRFIETADKLILKEALQITDGNQTRASKLLGITRPTLISKMNKYGIHREVHYREDES